jgi:hypothetical protein
VVSNEGVPVLITGPFDRLADAVPIQGHTRH